ncbi:MAG: heme biosynthesis HemY N-terminal domain-containing protein [Methyloprofundus sp.]|nr:heme biosynthesis HemY N-terminal domain-containing protein [Methyloprofundus sp.]MDT8425364.1 heme biosynthesis HemY N-terminal domain-containing protein [Methyloprofundus sp.]
MKNILFFLGALISALVFAFLVHEWLAQYDDPGYVLIGVGHWALETSLVVFAVALIIGFFVFYVFFRWLGWLIRLPGKIKMRGKSVKFNRSQDALISGLVDSAEGNWERAEKTLIRHASNSGAPLIHYLTAARAAHSRGAMDKRDEYLTRATKDAPGSEVAVGLTRAELHLSQKQFDQALETLTKLHTLDSSHASVLKMLHQTYQQLGDWQAIRKLLPAFHENKVFMEAEIKLLEVETFSLLLKEAAETSNAKEIQALWDSIPAYVQTMPGIPAIYFAAMIDAGAGAKIEKDLVRALNDKWDMTLLSLFGSVQSIDFRAQLEMAEKWLLAHGNDPILLRVLGKIAIKCKFSDKAKKYLAKSIGVEPTVEAYRILGNYLLEEGDQERASECFKLGLELASNEVIKSVNTLR